MTSDFKNLRAKVGPVFCIMKRSRCSDHGRGAKWTLHLFFAVFFKGGNMFKSALFAFSMVILAQNAFSQDIHIRGVRINGTGCSQTTASAVATEDGRTLSVLFDNYAVEIGNGSANPQSRSLQRDCRVLIDIDVTPGYQYALESTEYRGFAGLPSNAVGMHRFTQIIPGQPIVSVREAQLRGPIEQNYSVLQRQKPGRYVFSSCSNFSQTLEIMSQLSVSYLPNTTRRDLAIINLDSIDTGVESKFNLVWRPCP